MTKTERLLTEEVTLQARLLKLNERIAHLRSMPFADAFLQTAVVHICADAETLTIPFRGAPSEVAHRTADDLKAMARSVSAAELCVEAADMLLH